MKLPRKLLSDAGIVASGQDVTIGHLVRCLLAKEVERRLNPKAPNRAEEGLVAALQALLARDMAEADGWDDLDARLSLQGYALRPAGGGVALYRRSCGTRICKGSELGFAYRSLVRRFGIGMPGHSNGGVQWLEDVMHNKPVPPDPEPEFDVIDREWRAAVPQTKNAPTQGRSV